MNPVVTVRRVPVTVPAGGRLVMDQVGDFLFVEYASADCFARLESINGGTIAVGILIRSTASYKKFPRLFDRIILENSGGVDVTAIVIVGEGEFNLNLLSGDVTISTPTSFNSEGDQAIANNADYDVAADANRVELILEADEANSGNLLVRDASASTQEGKRLKPGETFIMRCQGAVRIRNHATGAAQNLFIAEIKR